MNSRTCRGWLAVCLSILAMVLLAQSSQAVETGPVDRKWGLGWANGLTARWWLGGVWELSLSGGPNDYLSREESHFYDTGRYPDWDEREAITTWEDKRESGFVSFQGGRLLSRRGPLAVIAYAGLRYHWSDNRDSRIEEDLTNPESSYTRTWDDYYSTWTAVLGLRPSFEILDFLTIETAFSLGYSWRKDEDSELRTYPETGRGTVTVQDRNSESFFYSGWSGLSSLQFIVWF